MKSIPQIILGTFQFHDTNELTTIVETAYRHNIVGFDTSPSYKTEGMLGQSLSILSSQYNISRENLFIQDKIDGWQMEITKGNITRFVESSLKQLKTEYLDVLLIHWPFPDYLNNTWNTFSELKEQGKVKYIGLSNVRKRHIEKLIKETCIKPDIIQIERHPLRTCSEDIDYCHKQNIIVEAYSPICRMDKRLIESEILKKISQKYKKNIGQIILRWHLDTQVIPVFMTRKTLRIQENSEIYDFSLTTEEIASINEMNINYKIFVESACCPGI